MSNQGAGVLYVKIAAPVNGFNHYFVLNTLEETLASV
jgi:hypothetical protein